MCRDCEIDSCIIASHAIVKRAALALAFAVVAFVGIDYLIYVVFLSHPHLLALSKARAWILQHATMIDVIGGYTVTAYPYGWATTSRARFPRGYLISIDWFIQLLEWQTIAALFIGPVVFPFAVCRDVRDYLRLRELIGIIDRMPVGSEEDGFGFRPRARGARRSLRRGQARLQGTYPDDLAQS